MATTTIGVKAGIGVIGVCLDRQTYHALTQIVGAVPTAVLAGNIDRYFAAEREVVRLLGHSQVRVCLVDFDQTPEEAIHTAERVHSEPGPVFVFAVSSSPDTERILAAMRAGCSEYLIKPLQNDRVLDALARVQAKYKDVRSASRGKVVTLLGAKGGSGVTSLALHLALHLCDGGSHKCLLVDAHPTLGDASLYLGTGRHQYSFYEFASNPERLDSELLKGFLLHHDSGLDLMDSPEALDAIHRAPGGDIEQTLAFLAGEYEYVVVDSPPGLTETALATLAQSDQVGIVITAELPAIRNAVRYLEHLQRLGYPEGQIRIVLNRHSKKSSLSEDQIEKALKRPIGIRIPNAYAEVIRAINAGVPIMPGQNSDFAVALEEWAEQLREKSEKKNAAGAADSRGGLWAKLGL